MQPALQPGDLIIGFKIPFLSSMTQIKRNRLVIHRCPGQKEFYCMKRIIARAGDRLQMINQRLNINGSSCSYKSQGRLSRGVRLSEICHGDHRELKITEDWADESWGPIVVPPDSFYVMNDNRADLSDSRIWGAIPTHLLVAEGVFIWSSFDWGAAGQDRLIPRIRWDRTFKRLH